MQVHAPVAQAKRVNQIYSGFVQLRAEHDDATTIRHRPCGVSGVPYTLMICGERGPYGSKVAFVHCSSNNFGSYCVCVLYFSLVFWYMVVRVMRFKGKLHGFVCAFCVAMNCGLQCMYIVIHPHATSSRQLATNQVIRVGREVGAFGLENNYGI